LFLRVINLNLHEQKELDLHDKNKLINYTSIHRKIVLESFRVKKEGPNPHPSGYVSGSSHHYRYQGAS
jgi:hypothetical protein